MMGTNEHIVEINLSQWKLAVYIEELTLDKDGCYVIYWFLFAF